MEGKLSKIYDDVETRWFSLKKISINFFVQWLAVTNHYIRGVCHILSQLSLNRKHTLSLKYDSIQWIGTFGQFKKWFYDSLEPLHDICIFIIVAKYLVYYTSKIDFLT